MRTLHWLCAAVIVVSLRSATAAELVVTLSDASGKPIGDAVVSLVARGSNRGEVRRPASVARVIDQKDEAFVPYLETFRPGDRVVFRNSDPTRHHVYSFSETKSFEFVLAAGESSTELVLDREGVIAAGCNIHDSMIAYLYVSAAPWLGRSGIDGRVRIDALPAGSYEVSVWHPLQRPGKALAAQHITIDPAVTSVTASYALSLLPDPRRPVDRERPGY